MGACGYFTLHTCGAQDPGSRARGPRPSPEQAPPRKHPALGPLTGALGLFAESAGFSPPEKSGAPEPHIWSAGETGGRAQGPTAGLQGLRGGGASEVERLVCRRQSEGLRMAPQSTCPARPASREGAFVQRVTTPQGLQAVHVPAQRAGDSSASGPRTAAGCRQARGSRALPRPRPALPMRTPGSHDCPTSGGWGGAFIPQNGQRDPEETPAPPCSPQPGSETDPDLHGQTGEDWWCLHTREGHPARDKEGTPCPVRAEGPGSCPARELSRTQDRAAGSTEQVAGAGRGGGTRIRRGVTFWWLDGCAWTRWTGSACSEQRGVSQSHWWRAAPWASPHTEHRAGVSGGCTHRTLTAKPVRPVPQKRQLCLSDKPRGVRQRTPRSAGGVGAAAASLWCWAGGRGETAS